MVFSTALALPRGVWSRASAALRLFLAVVVFVLTVVGASALRRPKEYARPFVGLGQSLNECTQRLDTMRANEIAAAKEALTAGKTPTLEMVRDLARARTLAGLLELFMRHEGELRANFVAKGVHYSQTFEELRHLEDQVAQAYSSTLPRRRS